MSNSRCRSAPVAVVVSSATWPACALVFVDCSDTEEENSGLDRGCLLLRLLVRPSHSAGVLVNVGTSSCKLFRRGEGSEA